MKGADKNNQLRLRGQKKTKNKLEVILSKEHLNRPMRQKRFKAER
jgi:hypothetical protein